MWPDWFEGSILAKADIMKICPYKIGYPPHSDGEFRGWNGETLTENKKTFLSVISDFNKGKAYEQQIKSWEQQLLFAMAMQVTVPESFLGPRPRLLTLTRSALLAPANAMRLHDTNVRGTHSQHASPCCPTLLIAADLTWHAVQLGLQI